MRKVTSEGRRERRSPLKPRLLRRLVRAVVSERRRRAGHDQVPHGRRRGAHDLPRRRAHRRGRGLRRRRVARAYRGAALRWRRAVGGSAGSGSAGSGTAARRGLEAGVSVGVCVGVSGPEPPAGSTGTRSSLESPAPSPTRRNFRTPSSGKSSTRRPTTRGNISWSVLAQEGSAWRTSSSRTPRATPRARTRPAMTSPAARFHAWVNRNRSAVRAGIAPRASGRLPARANPRERRRVRMEGFYRPGEAVSFAVFAGRGAGGKNEPDRGEPRRLRGDGGLELKGGGSPPWSHPGPEKRKTRGRAGLPCPGGEPGPKGVGPEHCNCPASLVGVGNPVFREPGDRTRRRTITRDVVPFTER